MLDHNAAPACYVCRCEEIDVAAVRAAVEAGALTVNDVKRRTKAGMGLCQGIYCVPAIAATIGDAAPDAEPVAPMTARPPARPIPLTALAALADDAP